jgi:hypothetical protein
MTNLANYLIIVSPYDVTRPSRVLPALLHLGPIIIIIIIFIQFHYDFAAEPTLVVACQDACSCDGNRNSSRSRRAARDGIQTACRRRLCGRPEEEDDDDDDKEEVDEEVLEEVHDKECVNKEEAGRKGVDVAIVFFIKEEEEEEQEEEAQRATSNSNIAGANAEAARPTRQGSAALQHLHVARSRSTPLSCAGGAAAATAAADFVNG